MDNKFSRKIDKHLKKYLPKDNSDLSSAMKYSTMIGGKRFRPYLCLEACKICGGNQNDAIPAACAIEMIHTFTLIHDDLPCMDNSDLRRGKPACHKVFGEDIALLAGDALNTLAFQIIAKYYEPAKAAQVVVELSRALINVVKGQVIDIQSEGKKISLEKLKKMHLLKTAALIGISLKIGAILANAGDNQLKSLSKYGQHLGLAFQIADDILDATSDSKIIGKPVGADEKNLKSTYVSILGLEKAGEFADLNSKKAKKALSRFGKKADNLIRVSDFAVNRKT
ncbi:hypothetical protein A3J90_03885 [candidate division WOR-1 bacterium RIFOXYC2_FULL_37_10]|nr:MAG: hypothetical protein A3J90_03885 [candidate division WOR-1 bacterium RIFOXYC2_FULL_37_10]